MNIDDRLLELVRDAVEPVLDRLERLEAKIDDLAKRGGAVAPLLNLDEVAGLLQISTRTVERKLAAGEFPPPIRISATRSRWLRTDVDAWLEGRRSTS